MGREADAINKLEGEIADEKAQLAGAYVKDADDIAAENSVLGNPTSASPQAATPAATAPAAPNQSGGTPT